MKRGKSVGRRDPRKGNRVTERQDSETPIAWGKKERIGVLDSHPHLGAEKEFKRREKKQGIPGRRK